jgi:hypothetical protein
VETTSLFYDVLCCKAGSEKVVRRILVAGWCFVGLFSLGISIRSSRMLITTMLIMSFRFATQVIADVIRSG